MKITLTKEEVREKFCFPKGSEIEIIDLKIENSAVQKTVKDTLKEFPVWKTIKIGTFKEKEVLKDSIKAKGYFIGSWANDLMDRPEFSLSEKESELDLVNVSVGELGFSGWTTYADICSKAKEFGLELAPAEVGPQLRLQYDDQPNGEWLRVGMEAIAGSGGDRLVFVVERGGGGRAWLRSDDGRPDSRWGAEGRFVFVRPRK